jgi:hypothetical protein
MENVLSSRVSVTFSRTNWLVKGKSDVKRNMWRYSGLVEQI